MGILPYKDTLRCHHLLTHGQAFDLHQNLVGGFSQNESIEDGPAFAEIK